MTTWTTIRTKLSAEGRTSASDGKGVIDPAGGDSVMTVDAQGESIEQRVVDEVLYRKAQGRNAPGGKPWIEIDPKEVAVQQGLSDQRIGEPARTPAYAKAITDKDVPKVDPTGHLGAAAAAVAARGRPPLRSSRHLPFVRPGSRTRGAVPLSGEIRPGGPSRCGTAS
ncbi:hypothetical protein [Streptomyces sp. NPDC000931]|uniref:hypothetical protein n=1 Tax=Streptomyces sp. NPDC000931 TaxID=3154372 RepID=UPI00331B3475